MVPEMIIDPPVGPYSQPAEIEAWIEQLQEFDSALPEVQEALAQAREWLEYSRS